MNRHYEMIMAKAENMDLVVLVGDKKGYWMKQHLNKDKISFDESFDHFLCHPKHTEACLHWLNGGMVVAKSKKVLRPYMIGAYDGGDWDPDYLFMCENVELIAKVKKREKWIIYRTDGSIVGPFDKKPENITGNGQIIKIEVV